MKIHKNKIQSFIYIGNDDMIDLESDTIPSVPKKFIAQLALKNGDIIAAPPEWRDKIWKWWYQARKDELIEFSNQAIIQVGRQLRGLK